MPLYLQTNVSSMFAQSALSRTNNAMQTTFTRLASGYRINSAADDAAGLAISETMNAQVKSYGAAQRNANDAISMVQVADGAAGQLGGILTRMRELAVQAKNGTLNTDDRANVDSEFQALLDEIDRVANGTKFNGIQIADSTATAVKFQVGIGTNTTLDEISVTFANMTATALDTGLASTASVSSITAANSAITAIDNAIKTVNTKRAQYGAAMNRFSSAIANIESTKTNLSAALGRIRDVDVAEETASMARQQVLSQAGASVLAQANQAPQLALSLLRG